MESGTTGADDSDEAETVEPETAEPETTESEDAEAGEQAAAIAESTGTPLLTMGLGSASATGIDASSGESSAQSVGEQD